MSRKSIYLLVILAVIAILGFALYLPARSSVKDGRTTQTALNEQNFPQEVGGLKLNGLLTGKQASQHITQLHGLDIPVPEAYMAMYGDQSRQLILYLSRSANEEDGRKLFQAMDEKMPGNKTFTNYKKVQVKGREMVNVQGAGMDNYYFRQGRAVFWIGVPGGDAAPLVEAVLKTFGDFS